MKISVVIATLNEASHLHSCLPVVPDRSEIEVIVADGGSRDGTPEVALAKGWEVCRSATGRAAQMNAGAKIASGEALLFLHGDTQLPEDFAIHVVRVLSLPNVVAGAFRLQIDTPTPGLKIIERFANWRSVHMHMPYGDQAIFLRADQFSAIGGFPAVPIMEDVELIRRLRKRGRIEIAPASILTSGRRWKNFGLWKTTAMNLACILAYYLGVSPSRIHRWYYGASNQRVASSASNTYAVQANPNSADTAGGTCARGQNHGK
jgi:uncharacterized protein